MVVLLLFSSSKIIVKNYYRNDVQIKNRNTFVQNLAFLLGIEIVE